MAKKRMFNNTVLDTDAFLDMPLSAQALYFHLNLRADDDGFISNPKRIQQYIGASEDDLKLLVLKSFVIAFDDGVIVIKHWRMHNTIRNDRYQPTNFQEDLALLGIKENKAYTLDFSKVETECIPNGNQMATKCIPNVSTDIGLDLDIDIDKDINNIRVSKDTLCQTDNVRQVIQDAWNSLNEYGIPKVERLSPNAKRTKSLNARLKEYSLDDVLQAIENIKNSDYLQGKVNDWQITFDWFVKPNNFPKVLEGNYNNKSSLKVATEANFQLTIKAYPIEVTNLRDSKKAWENAIRQLGDNKDSLRKIYSAICHYKASLKEQNKYAKNFDKWIETELDYWLEKVGS